jgi:hypothetical protein
VWATGFTHKYHSSLKTLARYKHTSLFFTTISWSVCSWQAIQPEPKQVKFLRGALLAKILLSLKQLLATKTLAYIVPTLGGVFAPGKFSASEVLPITL